MRDRLLRYYEQELAWLRRMGAEFGRTYQGVAAALALSPTRCDDPHVERLLEGFAFLAARVHLRLDDDAPELAEALLDAAYPQYVRPLPALSLVQVRPDPERVMKGGHAVPRGTPLRSREVGGEYCHFTTTQDVTLWPLRVAGARWTAPYALQPPVAAAAGAVAALRVELRCEGGAALSELEMDSLRFYLDAEPGLAGTLYELLCNNCVQVLVRDLSPGSRTEPVALPGAAVRPAGFGPDEAMLPLPGRALHGYRLLQEYFAFPEKFWFVDVTGLSRLRGAGFGPAAELVFLVSRFGREERRAALEAGVGPDTLRLGCTPVVNLFPRASEQIAVTQRDFEYRVEPDRHRPGTGVYAVEAVTGAEPDGRAVAFAPLHGYRAGAGGGPDVRWYARRRPRGWRPEEGSDVWLHFVDRHARLARPDAATVTARLLCHNGDLPARLEAGGPLSLTGGGPVQGVSLLVKPTELVQPAASGAHLWRLVSQLSLNYASLVEGGGDALRALLGLHALSGGSAAEKQVAGIVDVRGTPVHARVGGEMGVAFARGHRVEVTFDEDQYAGGGVYLLASVLERFLGLYVSMNSFSVLAARTRQRREPLREWAPRSGWKPLL